MLRFIPENGFLPLILLEVLFALPLAVVMTSCTEELGSVGMSDMVVVVKVPLLSTCRIELALHWPFRGVL